MGKQNYGKCVKCGSKNTTMIDDSFDYGAGHHGSGGTQIIKYKQCNDCGHEEDNNYGEY